MKLKCGFLDMKAGRKALSWPTRISFVTLMTSMVNDYLADKGGKEDMLNRAKRAKRT
jgi:hypothetical protein